MPVLEGLAVSYSQTLLAVAALSLSVASCASVESSEGNGVNPDVIRVAEDNLNPICARPLSAYDRYYARVRSGERDLIAARFVVRPLVFSLRRTFATRVPGVHGAFVTTERNLPSCKRRNSCDIVRLAIDPNSGDLIPLAPAQGELSLIIVCVTES